MDQNSTLQSGSSRNGRVKSLKSTKGSKRGPGMKQLRSEDLEVSESCSSKCFSVRSVVTAMCLVGIIVSSVLASVIITVESQDKAIKATRDSGDKATDQCWDFTSVTLNNITSDLLGYASNAVAQDIHNYIGSVLAEFTRLDTLVNRVNQGVDTTNWPWMRALQPHFYLSIKALGPEGIALSGVISQNDKYLMFYDIQGALRLMFNDGTKIDYPYAHTEVHGVDSRGISTGFQYHLGRLPAGNLSSRLYINSGVIPFDEIKFGHIVPYGSFVGMTALLLRRDAFGREVTVFLAVTLPKISLYLANMASQIRIGTSAVVRLYTCVANMWLVDAYNALNNTYEAEAHEQKSILTGVSDGLAADPSRPGVREDETKMLLKDVEATDNLTASIATAINGTYEQIVADGGFRLLDVEEWDNTTSKHYVLIRRINITEGIDWWFVSTLDYLYLYGDVIKEAALIQQNIESDKNKVEDDITEKRYITIGIVAGASIILISICIVITHYISKPIRNLVFEMHHVAEMDLDCNFQDSISSMYEVKSMQLSFLKMKKKLKEFRAFVPNALLNSNHELEIMEPPSGIVSIVFTDIVKSTELWERSSTGMNLAMETHNETIRAALDEHNGYEVKTIGDAFMVAFSNPVDTLHFCFQVQSIFASIDWPADLDLDQGLKVRMGVHIGHTIPEENPLTGRRDYRGTTVNVASRTEGKAYPGTVCLTADMYQAVKGDLHALGSPAVEDFGTHNLKGIEGAQRLYLLAPSKLAERVKKSNSRKSAYETNITIDHNKSASPQSGTPLAASPAGETNSQVSSANVSAAILPPPVCQSTKVSVPLSGFDLKQQKTGLTLVRGQVTVAVCRLLESSNTAIFDNCNTMVRVVVDAAGQTDGVVGNVTGRTMTIMWNASKPCKLHTTAALRFAAQLERRASGVMRVGIATGDMLYGNVGTVKRRFHTTFGRPLEAAEAAADHALQLGAFCLLSDCTLECRLCANPAISPFVRIVDMWMDSDTERQILMMELLTTKLMTQLEDAWGTISGSDPELEQYNVAVREAIAGTAGAVETLVTKAALTPEDVTLQRVVTLLGSLGPEYTPSHRVAVRFTNLPDGVLQSLSSLAKIAPLPGQRSGLRLQAF